MREDEGKSFNWLTVTTDFFYMQITIDMFVRGWTNCGVDQFECLSFCVNVHMCAYKIK